MSTPVFQEKKRAAAAGNAPEDLSVRMQHMIELQHEEHQLYSQLEAYDSVDQLGRGGGTEVSLKNNDNSNSNPLGTKSMSRSVGLSSLHNLQEQADMVHDMNMTAMMNQGEDEDGVGRGTLFFNSDKLNSAASHATQSSDDESHHHNPNLNAASRPMPMMSASTEDQRLWMQPIPKHHTTTRAEEEDANTYGYGAAAGMGGSSNLYGQPQAPHQTTQGNPYGYNEDPQRQQQEQPYRHQPRQNVSFLSACCSQVFKIIYMCLCCCSSDAIEQQALHRSFCYGAIDGMLTGSGIVAAFCGMSILAPTSTVAIRTFVVAFSASACFADSLCMALGHVWTTHVLVSTAAKERKEQRASIESNRPDAKGKLVDMLLERGMLKIDAMSLADTLEGYPDLFVSALVGDALIAGGVATDSPTNSGTMATTAGAVASTGSRGHLPYSDHPHQDASGLSSWKFPSYGEHLDEIDQEMNPEAAFVGSAMTESRREGLFMMMGFSLFAVVPSLIYLLIPMLIDTATAGHHHIKSSPSTSLTSSMESSEDGTDSAATSATSMVLTTASLVMFCLGAWKSTFLDSNWMLFGMETVVVLLVCVGAAFGVGAVLTACFPDLNVSIVTTSSLDT